MNKAFEIDSIYRCVTGELANFTQGQDYVAATAGLDAYTPRDVMRWLASPRYAATQEKTKE